MPNLNNFARTMLANEQHKMENKRETETKRSDREIDWKFQRRSSSYLPWWRRQQQRFTSTFTQMFAAIWKECQRIEHCRRDGNRHKLNQCSVENGILYRHTKRVAQLRLTFLHKVHAFLRFNHAWLNRLRQIYVLIAIDSMLMRPYVSNPHLFFNFRLSAAGETTGQQICVLGSCTWRSHTECRQVI